jgi:hypothetical protein
MNQWFVNIKVDREERPDLDASFMLARQVLTSSGGWPKADIAATSSSSVAHPSIWFGGFAKSDFPEAKTTD